MTRPTTEQLLVQVLMRTAEEALGALTKFEEGSPDHAEAKHLLELAFEPIWSRLPQLALATHSKGIGWNDRVVLTAEEDEHALLSTLVASGIHGITLVPGVEHEEMWRFLKLVQRKQRLDEDGDQDLVLMLFRADLHHLRYLVGPSRDQGDAALATEPLAVTQAIATSPLEPKGLKAAVKAEASADTRGIVRLEKFDSTLYFLDEKEVEYLKTSIDRQYSEDQGRNVLSLLLDVLEQRDEPDVRQEVIGVLGDLIPSLLGTGQFASVAYLTSELRKITRSTTFEPSQKSAMDALRTSVSRNDAITQLFHILNDGDIEPTSAQLGALIREMRHEAIQTAMVWIGQLERPAAKAALVTALEEFFTEWPAALAKMTTAHNRAVVHRALSIARKLRSAAFVEPVAEALRGSDPANRRLAISALSSIGTPAALKEITSTTADPAPEVRTAAFEALSARPYRGAERGLTAALTASDVEERGSAERRALFAAYGAVLGAGAVATLEPILKGKKGPLAKRPSSSTRACAAVALGVVNTPTARFALEKAAKDRDPLVRSAANSALRGEGG